MSGKYLTLMEALKNEGYTSGLVTSNGLFGQKNNTAEGFDYCDASAVDYMNTSSQNVTAVGEHAIEHRKSSPFFMFMLYMDPHDPYIQHKDFNFWDGSYNGRFTRWTWLAGPDARTRMADYPNELKRGKALYDSEIAYTDNSIGHLIDYLKRQGLYDNTMIVFLADHGEEFNEHGSFGHCMTLYNEALHVPCIVKLPGRREGRVVQGRWPLINIFPSIMKTIGSEVPEGLSGKPYNFYSLPDTLEETIYSATDSGSTLRSVIHRNFKYIYRVDTKKETLFDLSKDPGELSNINDKQPKVAHEMHELLTRHLNSLNKPDNEMLDELEYSDEEKQVLKSLSYM